MTLGAVLLVLHSQYEAKRAFQKYFNNSAGELRNSAMQVQGKVAKKIEGKIQRVEYRFSGPTPSIGKKYQGWLLNPKTGVTKYAGEFYPVNDKEFSLVFTTEAGASTYTNVIVSLESGVPEKPTQIFLGGSI